MIRTMSSTDASDVQLKLELAKIELANIDEEVKLAKIEADKEVQLAKIEADKELAVELAKLARIEIETPGILDHPCESIYLFLIQYSTR